jgi:hypothetical protein
METHRHVLGIVSTWGARLDRRLADFGAAHGARLLRWAVGLVYLWYGSLKLLGASPAIALVVRTVTWLPPRWAVYFVGGWEALLGLGLLFAGPLAMRLTLGLLLLHVAGTFQVFFLLPQDAFQGGNPLLPTLEGQYAFKNVIVIGAALTLWGRLRHVARPQDVDGALDVRRREPRRAREGWRLGRSLGRTTEADAPLRRVPWFRRRPAGRAP